MYFFTLIPNSRFGRFPAAAQPSRAVIKSGLELDYTDTKLTALFLAGARMSVIKLILARNTISCCGLNKLHR
jgi:hypothetical protein